MSRHGFTLVELLVVASILGLVILVTAATITAGVRVWDAARSYGEVDAEALFGLAVTEQDIASALPFAEIPFSGDRTRISFAGLPAGGAGETPALGTIEYAYDAGRRAWERRQWSYPGGHREAARPELLVRNVVAAQLSYVGMTPEGEARAVQETWTDTTSFPVRVGIVLTLDRDGERTSYERTVFIPATGK